ncbi:MAG: hypothetical protein QXI24_03590 [Acidilobaceae archaeon]
MNEMLKSRQYIMVIVENNKVNVAGRVYETSHTLLIGASELTATISYGSVRVEASFMLPPNVESQVDDVIKVSDPEAKYEVDTTGSRIAEIHHNEGYIIRGEVVSIRFESEDETGNIIVKVPKLKRLKAKKVEFKSSKKTTLNIMTMPFIIGVISVHDSTCIVKHIDDTIVIRAQ